MCPVHLLTSQATPGWARRTCPGCARRYQSGGDTSSTWSSSVDDGRGTGRPWIQRIWWQKGWRWPLAGGPCGGGGHLPYPSSVFVSFEPARSWSGAAERNLRIRRKKAKGHFSHFACQPVRNLTEHPNIYDGRPYKEDNFISRPYR